MDQAFDNLPAEILLDIIPYIPYSPSNLRNLCLTNRKLHSLIHAHEHSLVHEIKTAQFPQNTLGFFPGLRIADSASLRVLHERLETLGEVHQHWLKIVNHGLELHWLKGRWETIHKAGLLLLYRLQDAGSYEEKVALLQHLPATSLACLLFKLISSIKILRVYGPEPINGRYAKDDVMARSDVELAFEELLLLHGPEFFVVMLKAGKNEKTEWAVRTLETEIAGMESRQLPSTSGELKPPTLISSLRRAIAASAECEVSQTVSKMWEILSSTGFDDVDEGKLGMIVKGEQLERGMRRIF
ncbi:hypothetical protein LTR37_007352 [Vermiconidia calcicola]|uniref:Uncharacterized protein n=1 Tax=Vermiconidia calcicola TaxID=1690605 RepID=A0ACC3NDQ6_9PEZI|nr:hypothetical protein LTR37_007352 [Vermiconidia calcicola]